MFWGFGHMGSNGLFGIVWFAGLVVVAVYLFNRYGNRSGYHYGPPPPPPQPHQGGNASSPANALKILDERYARGEMSDEEYNTKKANILK